jgi:hypothetical protein
MDEEYLKRLLFSVARGVPQMATGFVDLASLPFTMTGLLEPEQAVGSTAYLTSKGLLPPPQEGLLSETSEMLASAISPAGAAKTGLLGLGAIAGARGAKGVNKAIKTAQDEAMEVAQRNAALPVEQGGLGLSADNTAMDRARAMGFETPAYHGTNADILAFDVTGKGKTRGAGAFFTDNPLVAETYVTGSGGGNIMPVMLKNDNLMSVNARGANWGDINTNDLFYKRKPLTAMFDELSPNTATTTDELGMLAKDFGSKGIQIRNVQDIGPNTHVFRAKEYLKNKYGIDVAEDWSNVTGKQFAEARDAVDKMFKTQKSTVTALQDPSAIRSQFAAFDPKRSKESDILASILAGLGLGSLSLLGTKEEEQF